MSNRLVQVFGPAFIDAGILSDFYNFLSALMLTLSACSDKEPLFLALPFSNEGSARTKVFLRYVSWINKLNVSWPFLKPKDPNGIYSSA